LANPLKHFFKKFPSLRQVVIDRGICSHYSDSSKGVRSAQTLQARGVVGPPSDKSDVVNLYEVPTPARGHPIIDRENSTAGASGAIARDRPTNAQLLLIHVFSCKQASGQSGCATALSEYYPLGREVTLGAKKVMGIIRVQPQNEDLTGVVKRIVQDLDDSHAYEGELFVTRVLPSRGFSATTPAGNPCLVIHEEKQVRLFGLIPYNRKKVILRVREGFYDIENKGSKDMFVRLKCKSCETIARKHLEEYGRKNQVTEIVYWGRSPFRPKYTVRPKFFTVL